jgi:hypothetical protein
MKEGKTLYIIIMNVRPFKNGGIHKLICVYVCVCLYIYIYIYIYIPVELYEGINWSNGGCI